MEKISLQISYSFLISTLILLACSRLSCCCNYKTYNDSLIPIEHSISMQTIDSPINGKFIYFGFWSLCIPQQTFKNYPQVVSDYISTLPENGQLLFLIQGKQRNLVLGYIYMDLISRQVIYNIVIFGDSKQILEFRFNPVEFEEEWILSLFTINFESSTFTVEMTGQIKQSISLQSDIKYEKIILGGLGYIGQGFNLNIFKGRLSQIYLSYSREDVQNSFQYMSQNCRIPLPQQGQEPVYFVKGLQIFEGSSSLFYTVNQFGNRYCLSGWVKYDASRIVTLAQYNLIRISLFKNYNFYQKFGDEILQILSLINKGNPKMTSISIITNNRYMPIMGQNDYNIIRPMVELFFEYSDRYHMGLQQWHYIKYEYGSKVPGKNSYIQIQFSTDLGLQERILNNIAAINSPFYINIGSDEFYSDILYASIFDFKFEYNYNEDKQILFQACHYSCQTCQGPLESNCITCDSQANRYFLQEISTCECQQGYINVANQSSCVDFSQIFTLVKVQEVFQVNAAQCQFGYFILPVNGDSAQCVKCPQSNSYNLLCVDCLYSPFTWYLKPICKYDLISVNDSPDDAFSYVERNELYQDLYLINDQGEMFQQEGVLDFCEMESDSPSCFQAAHKHLNKTIFLKCKQNYFTLNGNCAYVNPYCLQASAEGKCLQYQAGMYLKGDQLFQCPSNCELCEYNEETQSLYCLQCKEQFSLENGLCISCGNYCKACQKYYDPNTQNSYQRCLRCLDDSQYFISFDAINCQKNMIQNCLYAFQALSNNFQINTLDIYFSPRNDWDNIKTHCARCILYYGVIIDQNLCLKMHEVTCLSSIAQKVSNVPLDDNIYYTILEQDYYITPEGEELTFAFLEDYKIILTTYQYCIISDYYFQQKDIEVAQFQKYCSGYVKNCEVCLRETPYAYGMTQACLECEKGYYADRVSGKCYECPPELNCYKCKSQSKISKDGWKSQIRAYYKVVIEKQTDHTFKQYAQSENFDDYEIICSECYQGDELRNDRCVPSCPKQCLECQYINGQNLCVKCPKNQKGRMQSLSQNQCIECPQNCALCRLRSKDEILGINPLFDNDDYITYTHQCLKSFKDAEYYYNLELGTFVECSQHQQCNYEFILTFNLYCSELEYESELSQISSQYEQSIFRQQNLLFQDLVSGISFKEFEKDLFYHQANEQSIRTIILNISSVKEQVCKIKSNGIIKQIFSNNIFSTTNVELTLNFNNNTIIEFEKPLKFLNFNKITILGAIFNPISNEKLKQITFVSLYPQTITLQNIIYQQISIENDQSNMLFVNVKSVQFNNFKILGLVQNQIENFIEITETTNSKTITFINFQILNSFLQNQFTIYCHLNSDDNIYIDNLVVNSKFKNATLIQTGDQEQYGVLQMYNVVFQIDVLYCLSFLNIYSLRYVNINTMTIEYSEIQNSTLILLNNDNNIDNFKIQFSKFRQISYGIMNSELLLDNLQISLSNILLESNEYDYSTKFLFFQKYNNIQSQININELHILNNYISQNIQDLNLKTQYSALLYLELDIISIVNLEIVRGYGLMDLSISDVQKLKIQSIRISQGQQFKFLGLHQFIDCQLQQVKGESYLQSLFISSAINLQIEDLIIRSAQTYNSPILYYKSSEKIKQSQFETIQLSNIIIESNLMLLTNQKFQTAILFFESVQETTLQIQNITFYGNVLHEYIQNNLQISALLLNLNCILGQVIIRDSSFIKNIVINSTDSIIYIKSEKLVFHNCTFSENNVFNYALLQPYLLWGFLESQQVNSKQISSIFKIKSQSGNGRLLVEHLDIHMCDFEQSVGYSGGAFFIEAQKTSNISIINSSFSNLSTGFQKELGFGGSIYLDGTSSQQLIITFEDLTIKNIYAQEQGGFLYITAGTSQVQMFLNRLNIQNAYAKQGSVIYATFSSLQQSSQLIEFNNIFIENTQDGFINYLNQYTQLSKSEEILLINNRVQCFINSASKVSFFNVIIENIVLESAILISSITELSIKMLFISNSLINSNLIRISTNIYQDQIISLKNIQIQNITTVFKQNSYNCESNQIEQNPIQFACIKQSAPIDLFQKYKGKTMSYGDCIFSFINKNMDQIVLDDLNSGLILFLDLTEQTTIKLNQIKLGRINCQFCLNGLIYFNFQKISNLFDQQYISDIMISDSNCGRQGCLNIEKSNIQNRRLLESNEKFIKQLEQEFSINKYLCQYNFGTNGTCIYISNVKVKMQNCLFQFNNAQQSGGAVYVRESEEVLITNSWILKNQAKIGGGLYLEDSNDIDYLALQTQISNNSAELFGNNIVATPQKLTIVQFDEKTFLETVKIMDTDNILIEQVQQQLQQIKFDNEIRLPSGQKISSYVKFDKHSRSYSPLYLIFRVIAQGRDQQIIKNLRNTYCTLESRILNKSNNDDSGFFSNNLTNIQKVLFNETTQDYNLDELIVYFDNKQPSNIVLQLQFWCDSIIVPIYNKEYPYNILNKHSNYHLRVNIKTFDCQYGETKNYTDFSCIPCNSEQGLFSLTIDAQKCELKDDISTISVQSALLNLKAGYWRPYFETNRISNCINKPENCLGGWIEGDISCLKGHIGALCEECDLYGIREETHFSTSQKYSCASCQETSRNFILITFVTIWTLISIFISVQSNLKSIKQSIRVTSILLIKLAAIQTRNQSAILIKILTNYLQILAVIATFKLKLPIQFQSTIDTAGSPVQTMTYSMDCFLATLFSFEIQYGRMIWQIILPFVYISFFFTCYLIAIKFKLASYNKSVITTTIIYMYIYLQTSLVGGFAQLISSRNISGYQWIQANTSQRFDTSYHYRWILQFCIPMLTLLSIIIPSYFLFNLRRNSQNLDKNHVKLQWGYLYNEYKFKAYFWELIKISQKQLMMICLIYYDDNVILKATMVAIIIVVYLELSKKYKPYNRDQLNKLDCQTMNTCLATIILAAGIYISESTNVSEVKIPYFLLIAILNFLISYTLLQKIVVEYFKKAGFTMERVEKFKQSIRKLFPFLNRVPFISRLLMDHREKRKRVAELYMKLKQFLIPQAKEIIAFKISQQKLDSHRSSDQQIHTNQLSLRSLHPAKDQEYLIRESIKQSSLNSPKYVLESNVFDQIILKQNEQLKSKFNTKTQLSGNEKFNRDNKEE
ncbi:unnamed protein product [Paramecium octaurelia]|uniref:Transmembrane protein n=1 Tax=Paramecium octaurelia TaxID=43137 RepID=A0A8S1WVG7_PAROT|nr:unnamed protein product [Paramecium octaurelia]